MKTVKLFLVRWWLPIVLATIGVYLITAFYTDGFPYTHDGENHLVRFANYLAALREGQWPPRFAPYLQSGFGFPVFHYNYPLGNILAVPFLVLGSTPPEAFVWIVRLSLLLGVLAVGEGVRRRWGVVAAVVAAWTYLFSSYLVVALRIRGNIGEIVAYALVPVVVVLFDTLSPRAANWKKIGLSVVIAAFLLSHNVLAVIMAPLLALWSGWRWRKHWWSWLGVWLGSTGLVSWFWFPAILELPMVVLTDDSLAKEAVKHVLTWNQIWIEPIRFGFSRAGLIDTIGLSLGWGALIICTLALAFLVKQISHHLRLSPEQLALAVLVSGSLFLSSVYSSRIWETVLILSIIQFPWRLLFIVSLLLPILAAWVYSVWPRWWQRLAFAVLTMSLSWVWVQNVRIADRLHYSPEYYLSAPHSTTTRNENRPRTLPSISLPDWVPQPVVATGSAQLVQVEEWLGSRRSYTLQVEQDSIITERTIYFPGWETKVDGQRVEQIFTEETQGLIAYRLPARAEPYRIQSQFGRRTTVRAVSEFFTVFTAVVFLGILMVDIRRSGKKRE